MLLDDTHGLLNLLELFFNCFDSLYQAEYEFQNSNVGGKFERFYKNLRTLAMNTLALQFSYLSNAYFSFAYANFSMLK